MRLTPPVVITPDKLLSTDIAEPFAPSAYSAGTTYGFGDIVSVAADYAIYESLTDGNVGNTPSQSPLYWNYIGPTETPYNASTTYPIDATCSYNHYCYVSLVANNVGKPLPVRPATENAYWAEVSSTMKFAAFDLSRNTKSVIKAASTTVSIKPGQRINTLALLGMEANSVTIAVSSVVGGGVVYGPKTIDLNTRIVNDGYEYAFEPFSTQPSIALFDLPPYTDSVITVTFNKNSGNIKYGSIVVGTYIYLGNIQWGAQASALNFSTIERDIQGTATLIPRRSIPKNKMTLKVDSGRVNKIRAAREKMNAVPGLWTGLDDGANDWFDAFTNLGVYTQFEISAPVFGEAEITLEVEEL